MLKKKLSNSLSPNSNYANAKAKKQKCDSLSYCCTPIEKDVNMDIYETSSSDNIYLDPTCKTYFQNNSRLRHTHSDDIPEVIQYLTTRNLIFKKLDSFELNSEDKDCIVISRSKNKIKINNEIIQSKNIEISKYISNGCFGIIFVSSEVEGIKYVIKFIKINPNNENEINALIHVRQTNNTNIPNYVNIENYHLNCNGIANDQTNKILIGINTCLKTDKYSMIVLEYFDGTIFDLINNHFLLKIFTTTEIMPFIKIGELNLLNPEKNLNVPSYFVLQPIPELFYSIFAQLLLSIYLYHNKFKFYHNDTHLKNFLFKKVIQDDKYFHYKIKSKNYYIKNCGYIAVLSDFGLAKPIISYNIDNKNLLYDYSNILCELLKYVSPDIKTTILNYNKNLAVFDEYVFIINMMDILNIQKVKQDKILINQKPFK